MRHRILTNLSVSAVGLLMFAVGSSAFAQATPPGKPSSATPLMALVGRFTAPRAATKLPGVFTRTRARLCENSPTRVTSGESLRRGLTRARARV